MKLIGIVFNILNEGAKKKGFLPFEKARYYVRGLNLKNKVEWNSYVTSGKKPIEIPSAPQRIYLNQYIGMGDWLGTNTPSKKLMRKDFLPFEKAREFVRALNLSTSRDWIMYTRSGMKPNNIPATPLKSYPDEFKGYSDWIGITRLTNKRKGELFLKYEDARSYALGLNFKTKQEYENWSRTGNRPEKIPSRPDYIYKGKGWINWYEWLVGSPYVTDDEFKKQYNIQDKPKKFVSFLVAQDLARDINLNSKEEWYQYIKDNNPEGLPIKPQEFYKEKWISWEDFLDSSHRSGR